MQFEPGAMAPGGFIPLSVPQLRGNEWKYVKECLDTNWVSSAGPFVNRFEETLARYVGAAHAIATSSGTAALHIALLAAGVRPDDEVLVPALTFIAPANAVRYAGAYPVLVDVEPTYWQMNAELVADFLRRECRRTDGQTFNRTSGRRVSALLPVHILGHPVDMEPIIQLAREFGLAIIEDATESLGAEYKSTKVGCLGDIACFSFNGNKIITTGGGGMIVTDNPEWAEKARYLSTQAKDDPIEYVHKEIGYNYRMTNIQAALGCAQMEQIDDFIRAKRSIAETYARGFEKLNGVEVMREAPWAASIFWMFTVLVREAEYGEDSRGLMRRLRKERIQSRPLWQPLHRSPAHQKAQSLLTGCADIINQRALSLPCSVGVSQADLNNVIEIVSCRG